MTDPLRPQRRSRRVAMAAGERDTFLAEQRTCRVATVGPQGPHATPLWFVWDAGARPSGALWLYSIVASQRWADLQRDPRVGVVVDTGEDYLELRGVEVTGSVEVVGEIPRTGEPHAELAPVERAFAAKYVGPDAAAMQHDGRHGWLRVRPTKITSWDFRKLSG